MLAIQKGFRTELQFYNLLVPSPYSVCKRNVF